jgi:hypothetical protein
MMAVGPLAYKLFSAIHLYRVSTAGMAAQTAASAVLSLFYITGLVTIAIVYSNLSEKLRRALLVLPAALVFLCGNTLSNWSDPLILLDSAALLVVSLVLAAIWRFRPVRSPVSAL